jgi:hypothetical protein
MDQETFPVTAAIYRHTAIILLLLAFMVWVQSRQDAILLEIRKNIRTLALWQSRSYLAQKTRCTGAAVSTSTPTASNTPATHQTDALLRAVPNNTTIVNTSQEAGSGI